MKDVRVLDSAREAGRAAAEQARETLVSLGRVRIVVATGNSQVPLIDALVGMEGIDWSMVEVFHMDEYVGISADHPASFRRWLRTRLAERVPLGKMHYLDGDAVDLETEIARYAGLLTAAPLDLAFVGFGENGHIAFNDPPVADFEDRAVVKRVVLDEACRRQQAGEGHFPDVESVPREALTMTCPALFGADRWICCVPEKRKAEAVRCALEGSVSEACPASLVQRHPHAMVYLDRASAGLLHSLPLQ